VDKSNFNKHPTPPNLTLNASRAAWAWLLSATVQEDNKAFMKFCGLQKVKILPFFAPGFYGRQK
jgi:hypothetical protein